MDMESFEGHVHVLLKLIFYPSSDLWARPEDVCSGSRRCPTALLTHSLDDYQSHLRMLSRVAILQMTPQKPGGTASALHTRSAPSAENKGSGQHLATPVQSVPTTYCHSGPSIHTESESPLSPVCQAQGQCVFENNGPTPCLTGYGQAPQKSPQ